ncbi:transcriptional regulator [Methylovirgula ligni]|uniref:HxlR family transcriptional regulator n=1 Tax=Methylovirgula ligni TaxID=569860 RepID=A0A3D9Z116_9HYPH|nr:helix-turn-helix domain-containing protein [Methylovirgula ligni]QAY95805.1 transcriptional regulator [Methylovirgula ligni]REF88807.1 HxlR family transcriptional regulator [Methylovirgula ligni]
MRNGYALDCPIAHTLDVVGEKWSLLILRDLTLKGPLRFQDLEAGLGGVAPNTLSARLKTLEAQGVIGARLYEAHPPRYEYFLTAKGQALGPVLQALRNWGEHYAPDVAAPQSR